MARIRLTTCMFSLTTFQVAGAALNLTVLHTNDHHSHLAGLWKDVDGGAMGFSEDVRVHYGGYPRVVSAYASIKAEAEADGRGVLKVHAGDAVTGTSFFSLFKGAADAAMMAQVCFDAFCLGNHEFDDGDQTLADFIDALNANTSLCPGTVVVAANVVPGVGSPLAGKFQGSRTMVVNGEQVGIVGIDIKEKTLQFSSPSHGTTLTDERTAAQWQIDALIAAEVNKIILLTHVGYDLDTTWMASLTGVDIVIGGDSHSLLGDANTRAAGFTTVGPYPTELTNGDGKKVCVATAWEYSKAIGALEVDFDENGDVLRCGGTPKFAYDPTTMSFGDESDTALSSSELTVVGNYLATLGGQWVSAVEDTAADAALAEYQTRVTELQQQVIANVPQDICLDRFPGQGYGTLCDSVATQANGGGACQLVAGAFLAQARTADIAITNSGGCRSDIVAGDFTHDDAYTMLPFSNTLVVLHLRGASVRSALEDALDHGLTPDGSSGAYPYAAGLRFDVDASQGKGSRISNMEVNPQLAGSWAAFDDAEEYRVVTNNFLATGRDGYSSFTEATHVVDTYRHYAESLVMYCEDVGTLVRPHVSEFSTQAYTDSSGVVHSVRGVDLHVHGQVSRSPPRARAGASLLAQVVLALFFAPPL